jgi:hypothetical protein
VVERNREFRHWKRKGLGDNRGFVPRVDASGAQEPSQAQPFSGTLVFWVCLCLKNPQPLPVKTSPALTPDLHFRRLRLSGPPPGHWTPF